MRASNLRWLPDERLAPTDAERGRTVELDLSGYNEHHVSTEQYRGIHKHRYSQLPMR